MWAVVRRGWRDLGVRVPLSSALGPRAVIQSRPSQVRVFNRTESDSSSEWSCQPT
jgi:hypothetical protein